MGNEQKHRKRKNVIYTGYCEKQIIKKIKTGFYGDSGVGKSSIINSFLGLEFDKDILSTIAIDKKDTDYKINEGTAKKLILWDTSGQERFRNARMSCLKLIYGAFLVFDLTNKKSFENLDVWINEINDNSNNEKILVLLGNKVDCEKERREVNDEEIKKYAERKKLKYFEVSAKTKKGIDEAVKYIVDEILKKYER